MLLDFHSPERTFELGILATTFRRSSVDEVFEAIASCGLTCTHWDWGCVPGLSSLPSGVPIETARSVVRAAACSGVRICSVSADFNLVQPLVRDRGLSRLPALAEAALAVGSDLLTLCTGTRHPSDMWAHHPGNSSGQAWTDMISGLRSAGRIASRHGVRLAIEPNFGTVVCDAASAERALEELGGDGETISIALNAASLYRPPEDPRTHPEVLDDALDRLGEYISLARLTDIADPDVSLDAARRYDGKFTCPPGTGVLPYRDYLAALMQTPGISVTAESGQRLPLILQGLSEGEVAASVAFLRQTLMDLSRTRPSTLLDELVTPKRKTSLTRGTIRN